MTMDTVAAAATVAPGALMAIVAALSRQCRRSLPTTRSARRTIQIIRSPFRRPSHDHETQGALSVCGKELDATVAVFSRSCDDPFAVRKEIEGAVS
jgi:hypothetical protein